MSASPRLVRPQTSEAEAALIAAALQRLAKGDDALGTRAGALEALIQRGLPTRRSEAYHFTDLRSLIDRAYRPSTIETADHGPAEAYLAARPHLRPAAAISIANGAVKVLKSGEGVAVAGMAAASTGEANAFSVVPILAAALGGEGLVIDVAKSATPPLIVVVQWSDGEGRAQAASRALRLAEGAAATLVEVFIGAGDSDVFTISNLSVVLSPQARLTHIKIIDEAQPSRHLALAAAQVAAGASYEQIVLGLGGRLIRQETDVRLGGRGAHVGVRGGLLVVDGRHLDLTCRIDHAAPDTTSAQDVRAVLGGGRGVVQGAVRVAQGAQRTDARQMIRGLLLAERAELDAKPELEILADDVKCSHGTAIGDIDKDALFYLRSRGIGEGEARVLLAEAFLAGLFEEVAEEGIKAELMDAAERWLGQALGGSRHG